jgi:ssDNA-binding Zn-finger/Zn-ribbon topoisomerase 1
MVETWHEQFNPQRFLSRVKIDQFIEHNEAYNENKVDRLGKPCILCSGLQGPGLLLNDKSYLCKSCFAAVSTVRFPEKYEKVHRQFLTDREARQQARAAFVQNCMYRKISSWAGIAVWLSLPLLYFQIGFLIVSVASFLVYRATRTKHEEKITKWDAMYPMPAEPLLKHFHDPAADLTYRDRIILKVFNNWPGYPPFWGYLREVVLRRDGNRCQVSGCPSRVELHIHHKTPISQGGEHVPTNLVSLCSFHHALEPDEGHERIWGAIKTRYFTMVRAHSRRNPSSPGYHNVRAHVRRLELSEKPELFAIKDYYGLSCPSCNSGNLEINVDKKNQEVVVKCSDCGKNWAGRRQLSEETGPRLSEALSVTRNSGCWTPRWDMLETRADSTFRLLKKDSSKPKSNRKTIKSKEVVTNPSCPKCGNPMRLIKPRKGDKWKAFWGCSKYKVTGCNGSRDI